MVAKDFAKATYDGRIETNRLIDDVTIKPRSKAKLYDYMYRPKADRGIKNKRENDLNRKIEFGLEGSPL